jgi:RNA recognition motif-containing protein
MSRLAPTMVMNPIEQATSPAGVSFQSIQSHGSNGVPSSLLQTIRQQIEFYFSDQNLPKDVFLKKLLELDETGEGWVQLQVIANFNKVKQLTPQLDLIREALRSSTLLMVSEDGMHIRRKTPIIAKQADDHQSIETKGSTPEKRTIYVSKVPKDCNKEYLALVFGEYGTITRIDLPVDKKTGENKGIAFVEFGSEEEMLNAIQTFPSSKHKMVLKPFKPKSGIPKESVKQEKSEKVDTLQSKEAAHQEPKPDDTKANIKAAKQGDHKDKQKKGRDLGSQNAKEVVGREVPDSGGYDGQEAWSGRSRSNSKGVRLQTEWDPNPSNSGQRPKLNLRGQTESGKASFVPIRNPIGPTGDGRGFLTAGRGKVMVK